MRLDAHAEGGTQGATVTTSDVGSGDAWDAVLIGTGAAITYDNAHTYGGRAYKLVSGTSSTRLEWQSGSVGVQSEVWGRLYAYFTANPAAELVVMRLRRSAGQTARWGVNSSGKVVIRNAANSVIATSSTSVSLNQWVRLEFHCVPLTSNGTAECRIYNSPDSDSVTETISSTTAALTADTDEIHWGPVGTIGGETYWLDHLNLNSIGWPGPAGSRPPLPPMRRRAHLLVR